MAKKWQKWPENGSKMEFRAIFPTFLPGEAKIHISAIFVSISGRRPKMDLHQVYRIPSLGIDNASGKAPLLGQGV